MKGREREARLGEKSPGQTDRLTDGWMDKQTDNQQTGSTMNERPGMKEIGGC